ncbi:hypothetical protein RU639_009488 [Aspergillus parasiticus]
MSQTSCDTLLNELRVMRIVRDLWNADRCMAWMRPIAENMPLSLMCKKRHLMQSFLISIKPCPYYDQL